MSTKKVQNSSQSGKTNKGFGAGTKPGVEKVLTKLKAVNEELDAELAKVAVNTTESVVVEDNPAAVAPDVINSVDDEIDVDFNFGRTKGQGLRPKPERTTRERTQEYNKDPVVYVAGAKRELTILTTAPDFPGRNYYYRESTNPMELKNATGQRYSPDNLVSKEDIRWYKLELPELDVYITQGSQLTIDERINNHNGWEGEEGDWISPVPGKKPELFIVGSEVSCRSLSIGSSLVVNNSYLVTTGHIDAICAKVIGSRINVQNSIDIFNSSIYNGTMEGINRLTVRKSRYMRDIHISGFDQVNLSNVSTNGIFRLHAAWQSVSGLGLDIIDAYLTDFHAQFDSFTAVFGKEYGTDRPWAGNGLKIKRRTDYGYFAGATPIPFVRCGDYNIATPTALYLAKEIDTVSFPKEKQPLTYQPQFGTGLRPYGEGYPSLEDNSYTMGLRGGKLWEKARKDCFSDRNKYQSNVKTPVGMIGDNLIQSLVDQIKSRIKLYVEMAVLTEV